MPIQPDFAVIATSTISSILSALAGWALSTLKTERKNAREEREKDERENDALMHAIRTILWGNLVSMHLRHVTNKEDMTLKEYEYCEATYNDYHTLGGNGRGTRLWEEIRKCPIKESDMYE